MSETPPVDTSLQATDLAIGYRSGRRSWHCIARGFSPSLRHGELVCLLGPNGSGKSTLIRTLAGMQASLNGVIEIQGRPLATMSPAERARSLAVVLTEPVSAGMLTASALVAIGRHPHTRWHGSLTSTDRERIEWALNAVGATDLKERAVSELSDGERQKVLIARALAQDSSIVLLDEPSAFLDLPRRIELMGTLRTLAHEHRLSIMLSTHDLELAFQFADRLWLLDGKGSFCQGPPEALALEGAIGAAFENDAIAWNQELGTFQAKQSNPRSITLTADGVEGYWTRRLLVRHGFANTKIDQQTPSQISVQRKQDATVWEVRSGEESIRFTSLGAFAEWFAQNHRSL